MPCYCTPYYQILYTYIPSYYIPYTRYDIPYRSPFWVDIRSLGILPGLWVIRPGNSLKRRRKAFASLVVYRRRTELVPIQWVYRDRYVYIRHHRGFGVGIREFDTWTLWASRDRQAIVTRRCGVPVRLPRALVGSH